MHDEKWAEAVNKIASEIRADFIEQNSEYLLKIDGINVRFLKRGTDFIISPEIWLEEKHQNGKLHEPGLLSWLIVLARVVGEKRVVFYDIGALFGYYSIIASRIFKNVDVIAVEGNPISAEYIHQSIMTMQLDNAQVVNAVIGDRSQNAKYLINVFEFSKALSISAVKNDLSRVLKNSLKRVLNLFGKNYRLSKRILREIKTVTLLDILDDVAHGVEILKIDTEGYQAVFLPPAINALCERKAIILMELDSPTKMRKFGMSNDDMVQPFLQRGYVAYWSDHRVRGGKVEIVKKITGEYDKNSLIVLLPDSYH